MNHFTFIKYWLDACDHSRCYREKSQDIIELLCLYDLSLTCNQCKSIGMFSGMIIFTSMQTGISSPIPVTSCY
jgi:hypothetical protein